MDIYLWIFHKKLTRGFENVLHWLEKQNLLVCRTHQNLIMFLLSVIEKTFTLAQHYFLGGMLYSYTVDPSY